jgi:hypothetical protein
MPVQETKGSASAQGYGSGLSSQGSYIEDVFSTYLYTGNGSTQTITNGIDLSGKGGLVWTKTRNVANSNWFIDTARGGTQLLRSNTTEAQFTSAGTSITFGSSSYTVGSGDLNTSTQTEVSWTFREQAKFFDIVTYTGNGVSGRTVAHSLGSVPGFIVVKGTNTANAWTVYHRSLNNASGGSLYLNSTGAQDLDPTNWNSTDPTSTVFTLGSGATNTNGVTYVAYLFAHDAGGFGTSGTDNVISCGSFTTDGSGNATVNLGYEPQLVMMKYSSQSSDWIILDNMRGFRVTGNASPGNAGLFPNLSNAESTSNATISTYVDPKATGFTPIGFGLSKTVIYIAIRRGPMQVPTTGTSVYTALNTSSASGTLLTTNFPVDLAISTRRSDVTGKYVMDRLRGASNTPTTPNSGIVLNTTSISAESTAFDPPTGNWWNTTVVNGTWSGGISAINWMFRRAPGFFDIVCYTGTGVARTVTHNLTVAPELVIVKSRNRAGEDWPILTGASYNRFMYLNQTIASALGIDAYNCFGNGSSITPPTSSVFTVGTQTLVNASADTYVAYLFATVANVSKVGSYTGTGATQTINAGLASGARFVMIKRTDSTGNWFVWDTARGMVAGTDPRLALNSTAAELNANWVYTASTGFQIVTTDASVNASGGTYIYLAIA